MIFSLIGLHYRPCINSYKSLNVKIIYL